MERFEFSQLDNVVINEATQKYKDKITIKLIGDLTSKNMKGQNKLDAIIISINIITNQCSDKSITFSVIYKVKKEMMINSENYSVKDLEGSIMRDLKDKKHPLNKIYNLLIEVINVK